jgi:transcription antitermination factor NusG
MGQRRSAFRVAVDSASSTNFVEVLIGHGSQVAGTESAHIMVAQHPSAGRFKRWWALHTKPSAEKAVAAALTSRSIDHYLPLVEIHHTYAKSRATFSKPLFPGYVFLLGTDEDRLLALQTNRLVNVLHVPDQQRFCSELESVRVALTSGNPVRIYAALREGTRVRVTAGPLRGMEGVVERIGSRARIYASISVLGQSVTLEIDPAYLERSE